MQRKSPKNVFLLLSCKFLQAQKIVYSKNFSWGTKEIFFVNLNEK